MTDGLFIERLKSHHIINTIAGSIFNLGFWYFQIGMALPFLAIAIFAISFFVAFGKQRESEAKEREQYYSQE